MIKNYLPHQLFRWQRAAVHHAGQQVGCDFMNLVDEADLLTLMEEEDAEAYTAEKEAVAQAEKEALDPDADYTEDKGDFEIPMEDEPEEPGEGDNAEE